MIIHQPSIQLDQGEAIVSARIELDHQPCTVPPFIWFRFPETFSTTITERSDAFISALFLLGMALHEDIQVHGPVSPHLASGLNELQSIYQAWFPHLLQRIAIQYDQLDALPAHQAGSKVVAAFSGGVDSSYTLMQHVPPQLRVPDYRLSHVIFYQGLDIPLGNHEYYQWVQQLYADSLRDLAVEVIPCLTNVRAFTLGRLPWYIVHGSALISPALLLGNLIKTYLVASSWLFKKLVPWGSSPLTDHLFSTETIEVVHHGLPYGRMEKFDFISRWEPARKYLRVCSSTHLEVGKLNCGECEKCLRSMIMLEATGNLDKFTTFDRPLNKKDYLRWVPGYTTYVPQLFRYLVAEKKYNQLLLLFLPFLTSWLRKWSNKLLPGWLRSMLKKRYLPPDQDPFSYQQIPEELNIWHG
jgi:hypothetical protein